MPKLYRRICNFCKKEYIGRGKDYCSNKCASQIENKKRASKISQSLEGRCNRGSGWKHTEEWKKKSLIWKLGNKSNLGKKLSLEVRKKLSEAHKGEKAYNWKGDESANKIRLRHQLEAKLWREAVFTRDDWTCQKCKQRGGKLHAHHIKSFANFPKLRFAIDNGVTLCKKCHQGGHKK